MNPLPLSRIAQWTNGRLHGAEAGGDVLIETLFTDTRGFDASDGRAALFVALAGERFDGNDHVAAAAEAGARAALVSRPVMARIPQVVVQDTGHALAAIAAGMQHGREARVAAITGSNGKTGVKQMLLAILRQLGPSHANPGNFNNEIGLPLSVIQAPEDARYAIYEMGAGKPGDIVWLTAVARPDVALVNNVAPAHLERMGSLLGVADTKGAIYDALPADGVAVINADDAFAQYFAGRSHGRRVIRFALEASADVTARDVRMEDGGSSFTLVTPLGEAEVRLGLAGRHNVANALAAASMAIGLADAAPEVIAAAQAGPISGAAGHNLGDQASKFAFEIEAASELRIEALAGHPDVGIGDAAVGADRLLPAAELARLHVALHDVDAVLLVEGDAGHFVKTHHVVLADQTTLARGIVHEHLGHGGLAARSKRQVARHTNPTQFIMIAAQLKRVLAAWRKLQVVAHLVIEFCGVLAEAQGDVPPIHGRNHPDAVVHARFQVGLTPDLTAAEKGALPAVQRCGHRYGFA